MILTVYHATSSVFLNSIQSQGLKPTRIEDRFPELRNAMKELIGIAETGLSDREFHRQYGGMIAGAKQITALPGEEYYACSFEYGDVYVTASVERAKRYSKNEFGSEFLSRFCMLYRCCFIENQLGDKNEFDVRYPELTSLIDYKNRKGIILKVEIDTSKLLTENGKELSDRDFTLIEIDKSADKDIQRSFRLKNPVKPDDLEVWTCSDDDELVFEGKLLEFNIPQDWEQILSDIENES